MRLAVTGLCLALVVLVVPAIWGWQATGAVNPGYSSPVQGGAPLLTLPMSADAKGQLLSVVDPQQRTMAVYHVDAATGAITLRCVRNLTWDLQMMEFNAKAPLPGEIRSLLEQR